MYKYLECFFFFRNNNLVANNANAQKIELSSVKIAEGILQQQHLFSQTELMLHENTLSKLRQLTKEINDTNWMYEY